jgi:hypothetical protein
MLRGAGVLSTYPTLTERKVWSYAVADERIANRSADVPLPVEPGYEDKILERLKVSPRTSRAFAAFLSKASSPEADSRRLALFLYDVVYCRQIDKADPLIESLTGIKADNFEYAPEAIERFCGWVKPYIDFQRASGNTQDFEHILLELHNLAHLTAQTKRKSGRWRSSYSAAVCGLAKFMKQKTGKNRFPSLRKFLNETAALFAYDQDYSERSLREIVKYRQPKKVRNRG